MSNAWLLKLHATQGGQIATACLRRSAFGLPEQQDLLEVQWAHALPGLEGRFQLQRQRRAGLCSINVSSCNVVERHCCLKTYKFARVSQDAIPITPHAMFAFFRQQVRMHNARCVRPLAAIVREVSDAGKCLSSVMPHKSE